MSYHGSKYPEGVSPDYIEVFAKDITCPALRRKINDVLSSKTTTFFDCDGCGAKDSLIIVVDLETERLFLRPNSNCTK